MNYNEARSKIQTGDIINVRNNNGIGRKIIKFFTRSEYTHTGIAIWLNGGLWMAEINSGHNHLIPLSQLENIDFDVFECPVDRKLVEIEILDSLRVVVGYGILSFLIIGFYSFFKIKERIQSLKSKVCSEYVMTILIASGWNMPDEMLAPHDLAKKLKLKFEVRH